MARNARLHKAVQTREGELETAFVRDGAKEGMIREFRYAADSLNIERRLVTRLRFGTQGTNPGFVVTNLDLPAATLYDELYCQRGEAENRIEETQLDLFGTRASCHTFLTNSLRVPLAGLAYTLMQRLKDMALPGLIGCPVDRVRCAMRCNQCRKQDIGIQHHQHEPLGADCTASWAIALNFALSPVECRCFDNQAR